MNIVLPTDEIGNVLNNYIASTDEPVQRGLFNEFDELTVVDIPRKSLNNFMDRLSSDSDVPRGQKRNLSNIKMRELLTADRKETSRLKNIRARAHNTVKSFPFEYQLIALCAINTFFKHSEIAKYCGCQDSNFCRVDQIFPVVETCIRLLRELHGGEYTSREYASRRVVVAEKFGMSLNSLQNYISHLTDPKGCDMLGSSVQIEEIRSRVTNYDPTIHPVFLALNLTEVYFLTIVLRILCDEKGGEKTASDIAYDVYRQLSRYGKNEIGKMAKEFDIDFAKTPSGHVPQKGYRTECKDDFYTLEKRAIIESLRKKERKQ